MKKLYYAFSLFLLFIPGLAFTQTQTDTYHVTWETESQDMWGPNGSAFLMDTSINLFDVNEADVVTAGSITNIFGGDFGAMLSIDYWLRLGSNFNIEGFTTGWVDVNYPTIINLTYPASQTFNPGQTITIASDYQVDNGWYLETQFPTSGHISFDFYFGFNIDVDATVCVWSCSTFDVFEVGVPLDTTLLFDISDSNGVASITYPWYDPVLGFYMAHDTILPLIFNNLGGIGLSGMITLPYVETNDYMLPNDKCLYAKGDSAFMWFDLDILTFLGAFDPSLDSILDLLNGTINIGGGISIDYSLLTMHLLVTSYMVQDFSFCPTIWANLTFPNHYSFTETVPGSGAVVNSGYSNSITFQVDHNLNLDLPCAMPNHLPAYVKFSMDNNFRNHTWDSITFTFVLTAFTFTLNLPSFPILPDFCIPEYCINMPFPCPEKSLGNDTCWQQVCFPEVCTPATTPQPDLSYTIGPLINLSIPLGYIPITWFDQTWELAGFHPDNSGVGLFDTVMPNQMVMYPTPPFSTEIDGPNVICFGDTNAVITVHSIYGTPPYTYVWNTGDSTTTSATADSIMVGVGSYTVTVSDANGCTSTEQLIIYYVNPEIFIELTGTDINCAGDSTGMIVAHVWGGTPGYTYSWSPFGGTTDTASNLPHGTYILTVIDSVDCDKTDSITLIELHPLPPVNFTADVTEGCQPLVVNFSELSPDQGQTYLWDYHDSTAYDTTKNTTHIYQDYGTYDVSLTVVSIFGCDSTMYRPGYISVHPKPVAEFTYDPHIVKKTEYPTWTVFFEDHSTFAYAWDWDFNDPGSGTGNTSDLQSPAHSFSGENMYYVSLITTSDFGCKDTVVHKVEVINDILRFENVFTPNNDGYNDVFEIENVEKYPENKLTIYNRWGIKVFDTYQYRNTWNAEGVPDGVYYFIFNPGIIGSKPVEGTITIMR
ncbi:MAG TPA: gliding motility-associated C-terminal domain-containing protein [Bacteroidales bacterium]|nr:gliding motility-associated C-terminal domain-containing protein [Bacteroidales bacterium]